MKRKLFTLLVVGLLALTTCLISVAAEPPADDLPMPTDDMTVDELLRWQATAIVARSVTISANGTSNTEVMYTCYNLSNRIYLTVTLQKANGAVWSNYKTWTASGTGAMLFEQSLAVERGTYRAKVVGTVYDSSGNYIETVEVYTSTAIY